MCNRINEIKINDDEIVDLDDYDWRNIDDINMQIDIEWSQALNDLLELGYMEIIEDK